MTKVIQERLELAERFRRALSALQEAWERLRSPESQWDIRMAQGLISEALSHLASLRDEGLAVPLDWEREAERALRDAREAIAQAMEAAKEGRYHSAYNLAFRSSDLVERVLDPIGEEREEVT